MFKKKQTMIYDFSRLLQNQNQLPISDQSAQQFFVAHGFRKTQIPRVWFSCSVIITVGPIWKCVSVSTAINMPDLNQSAR